MSFYNTIFEKSKINMHYRRKIMARGMFDILNNIPAYADAKKIWYISLMESDCFWFDMIVNPPDNLPTDAAISSYLRKKKKKLRKYLIEDLYISFARDPRCVLIKISIRIFNGLAGTSACMLFLEKKDIR